MSLDYSYTLGYGFFVNEADAKVAGLDIDGGALYELSFDLLKNIPGGDLLDAYPATGMSSSEEKVFIALKRSAIYSDAHAPEHDEDSPFMIESFERVITPQESDALDAAADAFGLESYYPNSYFYMTVS